MLSRHCSRKLEAIHGRHRDVTYFFDKESYLLRKIETQVVSPQTGPDPVLNETFFSDHKSISGAMVPAKTRVLYNKKVWKGRMAVTIGIFYVLGGLFILGVAITMIILGRTLLPS